MSQSQFVRAVLEMSYIANGPLGSQMETIKDSSHLY
jgi:hypothetical protein